MNPERFGRDPANIWIRIRIRINPAIRIGVPDHFWLKFWCWRRFALSEHSLLVNNVSFSVSSRAALVCIVTIMPCIHHLKCPRV